MADNLALPSTVENGQEVGGVRALDIRFKRVTGKIEVWGLHDGTYRAATRSMRGNVNYYADGENPSEALNRLALNHYVQGAYTFERKGQCAQEQTNDARALNTSEWLANASIVDLLGARTYEHEWRMECDLIPKYMPPFPLPDTTPRVVVRHGRSFLRYSRGPLQGWGWDVYGDDLQTVGLAIRAIMEAPPPPQRISTADESKAQGAANPVRHETEK